MENKHTEALQKMELNLTEHPHELPKLIALFLDEWTPTAEDKERLVEHLTSCVHCQIALKYLFDKLLDSETGSGDDDKRLLLQLTDAIHKTRIKEESNPYIDRMLTHGRDSADHLYPRFAAHLQDCEACQCDVDETVDLLQKAEHAGLISLRHSETEL